VLLFLSSLLLSVAYAGPPVIWNGSDALFLNDGTIIVPGLAPGGVCKASSLGVFSVGLVDLSTETTGTLAASSVSGGTPNKFAYFNGSGVLSPIPEWDRNTYGGSDVSQIYVATDTGSTQSHVLNSITQIVSGTNDLTDTYFYGRNEIFQLAGTQDYQSITGTESIISQTDASEILGDVTHTFSRVALGAGGGTNSSNRSSVFKAETRASGGHVSNGMTAYTGSVNLDSGVDVGDADLYSGSVYVGGTVDYPHLFNTSMNIDGTVSELARIWNGFITIQPGATVNNVNLLAGGLSGEMTGNYTGINLNTNLNTVVGAGSTDLQIYHGGEVAGFNSMIQLNREGDSLSGLTMISSFVNSGSTVTGNYSGLSLGSQADISGNAAGAQVFLDGTVGGNYSGLSVGSDADIAGGASGVQVFLDGTVGDGFTGFGVFANATDIGDGDSYNVAYDASFNNGTIDGSLNGFIFNNQNNLTGTTNDLRIFSGNNSGTGKSFSGLSLTNQADMTGDSTGINVQIDGDSATTTGANISVGGAHTGSVGGLRIDVNNATSSSTSEHVYGINSQGGINSIFGSYTPFSGVPVEIGNGFFMNSTVQAGAPLTGTDQFVTFIQSNLIVNDDIATGPFGLNTNMVGAISQLQIDTGKTVPMVTSLLVGTATPTGVSGGTVTEHRVLEILGLPSFGGSAINPTRIGLLDSDKLGQSFCSGATDCWFIKNMDYTAQNTLGRLSLGVTTTAGNTKLLVHDGHIGVTQTTAPTTTVNANAGTGATCSVSGTDTAGTVSLTTGSGAWASGVQCEVDFNMSYSAAPRCVFSASNSNAAVASVNAYLTKTTADFSMNFVNADTAATTYEWDYQCVE